MAIAQSKAMTTTPFTGEFTVEQYLAHPGEAHTWVEEGTYARQRTIREHHIEFLKYLIATGQMRPGTEVARARLGSKDYYINGNHTLRAIVRADHPLWITLTTYHVTTQQEIDLLYTTYDRQLPRSARDMLKAYGFADHAGLSQRQSEVLFGAMRLILSGFVHAIPRATKDHGYLRDNELLYMAALEWIDEATEFCNDIAGVPKRWNHFLLRQSLMAVAVVQYRNEPGRAETFWHQVAHENHPEPRHPTRLLAKWFQTESLKERTSQVEFVYATALAWNAAYHDNPLRSFTLPSTEVPLALEGTKHSRASVMRYITNDWQLTEEPVAYDEPKMRKGSRVLA